MRLHRSATACALKEISKIFLKGNTGERSMKNRIYSQNNVRPANPPKAVRQQRAEGDSPQQGVLRRRLRVDHRPGCERGPQRRLGLQVSRRPKLQAGV